MSAISANTEGDEVAVRKTVGDAVGVGKPVGDEVVAVDGSAGDGLAAGSTDVDANAVPSTDRGRRTRAALVAAARRVFERLGYLETRVADVVAEAGVSHGTFYTYFSSKEQVFREVAESLVERFREFARKEPRRGDDLVSRIERANRAFMRAYKENARMMAIIEQVATFNPELRELRRELRHFWTERAEAAITRWRDAGIISPDIDPKYAASALCSMVDRTAYVWLVLGEPFEFEAAVRNLTGMYARALGLQCGTPPPRSADEVQELARGI